MRYPEAFATEEAVDAAAETMIYSANDQDVTPPVAEYPRLPASPPASVPAESLSTLELLVGETGQVESVRLRGRPRHLGEALLVTMNLSAAKTWRFVPARQRRTAGEVSKAGAGMADHAVIVAPFSSNVRLT